MTRRSAGSETGRIFGLGLSRTGTTTLAAALRMLGYRTVDFPNDARTLNQLRQGDFKLDILEVCDAVTDIPLVPYYAQLDTLFPLSKFILTLRDIDSWLASVERHWLRWRYRDPNRVGTDFICACVYGVEGFNRDRFRFVYETHVANVRTYFRFRPYSFLEINIVGGEGWEVLCPFLQKGIPKEDFPHRNSGESNNDWLRSLDMLSTELLSHLRGERVIVVDDGKLLTFLEKLPFSAIPFPSVQGEYFGRPVDGQQAIEELKRCQAQGLTRVAVGWPAFWWLDYYSELGAYLQQRYREIHTSDVLRIFKLL